MVLSEMPAVMFTEMYQQRLQTSVSKNKLFCLHLELMGIVVELQSQKKMLRFMKSARAPEQSVPRTAPLFFISLSSFSRLV